MSAGALMPGRGRQGRRSDGELALGVVWALWSWRLELALVVVVVLRRGRAGAGDGRCGRDRRRLRRRGFGGGWLAGRDDGCCSGCTSRVCGGRWVARRSMPGWRRIRGRSRGCCRRAGWPPATVCGSVSGAGGRSPSSRRARSSWLRVFARETCGCSARRRTRRRGRCSWCAAIRSRRCRRCAGRWRRRRSSRCGIRFRSAWTSRARRCPCCCPSATC